MTHDRVRPERHTARRLRNGQRRSNRAEAGVDIAAVAAVAAKVTFVTPLHVRARLCGQHGDARRDAATARLFRAATEQVLAAGERHRRHEFAVGQMRNVILITADADEIFGLVVVRLDVFVADRPVVAEAVVAGGFEIKVAHAPREATPVQALAADDAGAHPHKRLAGIGGVGMLSVFDVKVAREFARRVLHPLIVVAPAGLAEAAIHGFPRILVRIHIA